MVGVPQVETSQFILGLGVYIQTLHWSPSFTRALLPRMLRWCIDSWQLRVMVAQDQRMQRRLLDAMKEEGLKN